MTAKWYHGSSVSGISRFELRDGRWGSLEAGEGIYLTESFSLARNRYAIGGSVYECRLLSMGLLDATNEAALSEFVSDVERSCGLQLDRHGGVRAVVARVVRGQASVDAIPDLLARAAGGDERIIEAAREALSVYAGYIYFDSAQGGGLARIAVIRDPARVTIVREIPFGSDEEVDLL